MEKDIDYKIDFLESPMRTTLAMKENLKTIKR
jgi:hypothetical protein